MAKLNPRIVNKLKRIPAVAVEAASRAMEDEAQKIVVQMKANAPVGNYPGGGDLRESIGWTWGEVPKGSFAIAEVRSGKNKGDQYATLRITIYVGKFYAKFIEFGTAPHSLQLNASVLRGLRQEEGGRHPGTAAQPFFYPTWKAQRGNFRNRIRKDVKAAIRREFGNG